MVYVVAIMLGIGQVLYLFQGEHMKNICAEASAHLIELKSCKDVDITNDRIERFRD